MLLTPPTARGPSMHSADECAHERHAGVSTCSPIAARRPSHATVASIRARGRLIAADGGWTRLTSGPPPVSCARSCHLGMTGRGASPRVVTPGVGYATSSRRRLADHPGDRRYRPGEGVAFTQKYVICMRRRWDFRASLRVQPPAAGVCVRHSADKGYVIRTRPRRPADRSVRGNRSASRRPSGRHEGRTGRGAGGH